MYSILLFADDISIASSTYHDTTTHFNERRETLPRATIHFSSSSRFRNAMMVDHTYNINDLDNIMVDEDADELIATFSDRNLSLHRYNDNDESGIDGNTYMTANSSFDCYVVSPVSKRHQTASGSNNSSSSTSSSRSKACGVMSSCTIL